jgi:hypothetical protein
MTLVRAQYLKSPRSLAEMVAALISILGLAALAAVFFRQ